MDKKAGILSQWMTSSAMVKRFRWMALKNDRPFVIEKSPAWPSCFSGFFDSAL